MAAPDRDRLVRPEPDPAGRADDAPAGDRVGRREVDVPESHGALRRGLLDPLAGRRERVGGARLDGEDLGRHGAGLDVRLRWCAGVGDDGELDRAEGLGLGRDDDRRRTAGTGTPRRSPTSRARPRTAETDDERRPRLAPRDGVTDTVARRTARCRSRRPGLRTDAPRAVAARGADRRGGRQSAAAVAAVARRPPRPARPSRARSAAAATGVPVPARPPRPASPRRAGRGSAVRPGRRRRTRPAPPAPAAALAAAASWPCGRPPPKPARPRRSDPRRTARGGGSEASYSWTVAKTGRPADAARARVAESPAMTDRRFSWVSASRARSRKLIRDVATREPYGSTTATRPDSTARTRAAAEVISSSTSR